MSEPWHTILSVVGMVGGFIAFFVLIIMRQNDKRMSDLEKDRDEARADAKTLAERVRLDELATRDLSADVGVLTERLSSFSAQLTDLRNHQVPRAEWEQRMNALEGDFRDIKQLLLDVSARLPSGRQESAATRKHRKPS